MLVSSVFLFSSCSDTDDRPMYAPTGKEVTVIRYKLGIHPYLDSKNMYRAYRPMIDFVENKLGGGSRSS